MTYAAAIRDLYTARCNLSAAWDHHKTPDNLRSTAMSSSEACSNLSTAADLQLNLVKKGPNLRNP
ncbi:hypothetical protein LZ11_01566 [Thermosediminibacter litoriperuensis]|uniref:Uncharacterized protein n=1 Tax=Thermosediminibacter litoriperuensis TaxID=291989 RepID=A0A5S5AQB6_9FIRM|nr:hypothetical protein LZ11_01566 [Thermosediminibacter litoriperuensis]